MHPLLFRILDPIACLKNALLPEFRADGLAVSGRNLGFLHGTAFETAWEMSKAANRGAWRGNVPDVRWRAHIACWAADIARHLDGDFVECGVFTGLLSLTVLNYLRLSAYGQENRKFYLFDTYDGIPDFDLSVGEKLAAVSLNRQTYFDCFDIAQRNFAPFPNAVLVRGVLPMSLESVPSLNRISYLSLDLNGAAASLAVMERLWPMMVPGAIAVLDDYGFAGHDVQHEALNAFAHGNNVSIATLPTGQGLLIKSPY